MPIGHGWLHCQEAMPPYHSVRLPRLSRPGKLTRRTELHFDTYISASKAVREVLLQVCTLAQHLVTTLTFSTMKTS